MGAKRPKSLVLNIKTSGKQHLVAENMFCQDCFQVWHINISIIQEKYNPRLQLSCHKIKHYYSQS